MEIATRPKFHDSHDGVFQRGKIIRGQLAFVEAVILRVFLFKHVEAVHAGGERFVNPREQE